MIVNGQILSNVMQNEQFFRMLMTFTFKFFLRNIAYESGY